MRLQIFPRCAPVTFGVIYFVIATVVSGCVGANAKKASVAYFEVQGAWDSVPDSSMIINKETGVALSVLPLNLKSGDGLGFFVQIASFQKEKQRVAIDLRRVALSFDGKISRGEGWKCERSTVPRGSVRIEEYSTDIGCAFIRFPVPPPPIGAHFSIAFELVSVDGIPLELPPVSFKEGVIRYRGGF